MRYFKRDAEVAVATGSGDLSEPAENRGQSIAASSPEPFDGPSLDLDMISSTTSPRQPSPPLPDDRETLSHADFRGSRRLVGTEEWFWYLVAAVSYILLGIWHKWLLNWFVGPAWLVAIIVVGPWLTDRFGLTGRRSGVDT